MTVTRDVVTDLLPVYFSGEASADTRERVEDFFRHDPDFERVARSAAKPFETLREAVPIAPEADREKRDLECIRHELRWRRVMFGLALFLTLAPLAFVYSKGHLVWLMARNAPWDAAFYWTWGALLWFIYFARLRRRTLALVAGIFCTVVPPLFAMHFSLSAWPQLRDNQGEVLIAWIGAAACWYGYFRRHPR